MATKGSMKHGYVVMAMCFMHSVILADSIPANGTDHGNPNLTCRTATWKDILTFYLANYVAHAATIKTYPGEGAVSMALGALMALFFPVNGVSRAFDAIVRFPVRSIVRNQNLRAAAQAGALCMVVRTEKWKPRLGEAVELLTARTQPQDLVDRVEGRELHGIQAPLRDGYEGPPERAAFQCHIYNPVYAFDQSLSSMLTPQATPGFLSDRTIHGRCQLAEGYDLQLVPSDAAVEFLGGNAATEPTNRDDLERQANPEPIPPAANIVRKDDTNILLRDWHKYWKRYWATPPNVPLVACSYSWTKAVIALLQAFWAILTLYRTRGDQIQRFGYAAFGLTVIPYAIMSIINLISNLVSPTYPALYIVGSDILDEARSRGSIIDGVIGTLVPHHDAQAHTTAQVVNITDPNGSSLYPTIELQFQEDATETQSLIRGTLKAVDNVTRLTIPSCNPFRKHVKNASLENPGHHEYRESIAVAAIIPVYLLGALVFSIYGAMSKFENGGSTLPQRVWIMCWMVFGCLFSMDYYASFLSMTKNKTGESEVPLLWILLPYSATAIGGFVVVGQMIASYGQCIYFNAD